MGYGLAINSSNEVDKVVGTLTCTICSLYLRVIAFVIISLSYASRPSLSFFS
ncbi:hypothetical protein X777_00826 [Ooceraea biroi]|uniref:Uncharacterized protein n=1 Tax=Ooceraea biroi TaxID=2015173 RepID=A0A026WPX6_OOCBI|nr:hypothetical protein X777_00826 [Ooceraea biroi]